MSAKALMLKYIAVVLVFMVHLLVNYLIELRLYLITDYIKARGAEMTTYRLYYDNPYTMEFDAWVLEQTKSPEGYQVILDRTAFFPAGGGQPCDTGWLGQAAVVDVIEQHGAIVHILDSAVSLGPITGRVDQYRRFDHMQQHSGQHILSSCFEKLFDADTVGFHLGSQYVYIDLNRQDLTEDDINKAEDMANNIVFENRPVNTHIVDGSSLSRFPLRKPPVVGYDIRIVEIDGFDYCPCCGTHVRSTGSVGIIKIRRWEKNKDNLRLEFVCGIRALKDYREKNRSINNICSMLSVRDFEAMDTVKRLSLENKSLAKDLANSREELCKLEAENLLRSAAIIGPTRIVKYMFYRRPFDELKLIAAGVTAASSSVAILCTADHKAQIVVSRSNDLPIDLRPIFRDAISHAGGKGGGSDRVVQGGLDSAEIAQQVMDTIYTTVLQGIKSL
jgi:alanyl-tRNA synthetase